MHISQFQHRYGQDARKRGRGGEARGGSEEEGGSERRRKRPGEAGGGGWKQAEDDGAKRRRTEAAVEAKRKGGGGRYPPFFFSGHPRKLAPIAKGVAMEVAGFQAAAEAAASTKVHGRRQRGAQ